MEPGIFLPELVRRTPFQVSHQAMNAKFWVHFTMKIYVVGHYLYQTLIGTVDQHLSAIFWIPDNVILTGIDHMPIGFEAMLIIRTHVLIIRLCSQTCKHAIRRSALPALYPHR